MIKSVLTLGLVISFSFKFIMEYSLHRTKIYKKSVC